MNLLFQTLSMLNIYTIWAIVIQKINITSFVIKYFYYFRSVSFRGCINSLININMIYVKKMSVLDFLNVKNASP
ncbi:hypothetical protein B9T20_09530 [Wohlfahrtiimonas sp. G9077]|nr:hypothetical protein B9T20_09530 [Wohlfahrtiimonas sp. G9077]